MINDLANCRTRKREVPLNRKPINPSQWSLQLGFNQAELIEGQRRTLVCSGQAAINPEGVPQHPGDLGAQLSLALDNLEEVLGSAGMSLSNVIRLNIYTTDVDEFLRNGGVLGERLSAAKVMPPATLLGVGRLAFPELMIEIEATAAD